MGLDDEAIAGTSTVVREGARGIARTRAASTRIPLNDRRVQVIEHVARCGEAFADDLTRLFFPDRSTANRTLRKLVTAGYLRRHRYDSTASHGYSLTARGVDAARRARVSDEQIHRVRAVVAPDPHLRLGHGLWTEFLLAARTHPELELVAWWTERDLRRAAGTEPPALVPDALAHLRYASGHEIVAAFEVDLETEALTVIEKKASTAREFVDARRPFWGAAPGSWRPVIVVPSEARARSVARTIVNAGAGALWMVAEFATIRAVGAYGPAYLTAAEVAATPRGQKLAYAGALVAEAKR